MKAFIDRLLAQNPGELSRYISSVNAPPHDPTRIDDGPTYDGRQPEKPDFLRKDDAGWERLD